MKTRLNYLQLAAEFVIVFVGVAVALAADSWREGINNRSVEAEYLQRLQDDLSKGLQVFIEEKDRLEQAHGGTEFLISFAESPVSMPDNEELVRNYSLAAGTGRSTVTWLNNITYRELISTGNLNLIRSSNLRSEIGEYYNLVDDAVERRANFSETIWTRFRELTGESGRSLYAGDGPSEDVKERLLAELLENTDIVEDLRLQKAQLENILRRILVLLDSNRKLRDNIANSLM